MQFRLTLNIRTNDNVSLIAEEWKSPREWGQYHQWDSRSQETSSNITNDWLLHHWEHSHDALAFRLNCKAKIKSEHICRSSHRAINRVSNDLREAAANAIVRYRVFRGFELDQLPINNTKSEIFSMSEIATTSFTRMNDRLRENSNLIFKACSKKIIESLLAHLNDSSYGWDLYLEEGFAVFDSIRNIALFLMFDLVVEVLTYCIKQFAIAKFSVFGLWSVTLSLCTIIAMFIFKYAEAKK